MSMLPGGLEIVENDNTVEVQVCRADPSGPWFTLEVKRISVDKFRGLSQRNAAPAGTKPGSRAAKLHERKFVDAFVKSTLAGWSGLTLDNLEEILPGRSVGGEEAGEWRETGREIPFSTEAATYLYQEVWPDKFSDLILRAIKEGVDAQEAEDDERKES
jgi:hypothetical protein